ncbi:MAG: hypothetical protein ACP5D7_15805 [Limnospira sp.]
MQPISPLLTFCKATALLDPLKLPSEAGDLSRSVPNFPTAEDCLTRDRIKFCCISAIARSTRRGEQPILVYCN